jgi:hypothetical protein
MNFSNTLDFEKYAYARRHRNQNPPQSPFSKGGSDSPPFEKGRLGGILKYFFNQLN